jgi:flagellar hook-associated protein 2
MSAINFTGLASGLDTDSIIKGLMEMEKKPLNRLEGDKVYFQKRLDGYKEFDGKLSALNSAVDALDLNSDLKQSEVTLSSDEAITASATSAPEGTYEIAVEQLAQVQKSVSSGAYASLSDPAFGTGEITLTVGEGVVSEGATGTSHTIAIDSANNTLSGIAAAINQGMDDHGISATVIDNGSDEGGRYHLMLTGADASTEFTLESGLSGGTETLSMEPPAQEAQEAVAYLDGVRITSRTNTIENAVSGLTLNLEGVSPEDAEGELEPTKVQIQTNTASVVEKMQNFVKAYNDAVSFVTAQSRIGDSESGLLVGDAGLNTVKRGLQGMLVETVEGNDTYKALTQLGLSTKRDGTLSFNSGALTEAMENNFDEVSRLVAGDDQVEGIFKRYRSYLNDMTDSRTGLLATRQDNIERVIDRIDGDMAIMEERLEKREEMLLVKFSALEQMVSEMNAQSDYLTQQMDKMPSFGGKD